MGRNAVAAALHGGRRISALYVRRDSAMRGSIVPLIARARALDIPIKEVDQGKLNRITGGGNHQGVAATVAEKAFVPVSRLLDTARERGEAPFLFVCDGISDPHNLGAIIRTASCAGAHGVIIPKHHSVGLTYAVAKGAAGALEHVGVAQVPNLTRALQALKEEGLWIYAAHMAGEAYHRLDYRGPLALIIGAEGSGISRLVLAQADHVVSIPMQGPVGSLNASVAAGILAFEIARSRSPQPPKGSA